MGTQPDYSRAALARFIEFVVAKGLVHPATAQGWRVATMKVLEDLSPAEEEDVRRIDVEATFKNFLNRYPGRLSPASVGEYRRRVRRAIEEFCRWMDDPGSYAFRSPVRSGRAEARRRLDPRAGNRGRRRHGRSPPARGPEVRASHRTAWRSTIRCARTCWRRSSFRATSRSQEAERMGAFLLTLAVDFRPAPAREREAS